MNIGAGARAPAPLPLLDRGQIGLVSVETTRMTEAAGADASAAVRVVRDVEHDGVRTRRISRDSAHSGEVVEIEVVAHAPADAMVRAGSVAAHADRADHSPVRVVERETAAKHVHATDLLAHH